MYDEVKTIIAALMQLKSDSSSKKFLRIFPHSLENYIERVKLDTGNLSDNNSNTIEDTLLARK